MSIYSNYASKLNNEKISNPKIILKGFHVQPITQITNPPVNYVDVDLSAKYDNYDIFNGVKNNIPIDLPEGDRAGQEWTAGLLSGVILFGPILVAVLPFAIGAAVSTAIAETAISASIGSTAALSLGIDTALTTASVIGSISVVATALELASKINNGSINTEELAKQIRNLFINEYSGNAKSEVATYISKEIIENVSWDNQRKIEIEMKKMSQKESYFSFKDKNLYENSNLDIHSVLYGNAHAASVWGDRTAFKMRGLFVTLSGGFNYESISYDPII